MLKIPGSESHSYLRGYFLNRNFRRLQKHIEILEIRQVFKIHKVLFVIGLKVRVGWCRQCLTSQVKPSHISCLSCPRQYWGRQEGIVPPHYLHSLPTQTQQLDPIATYTSVHSRLVCMPWVWTTAFLLTGCPGPILHMFLGSQVCGQKVSNNILFIEIHARRVDLYLTTNTCTCILITHNDNVGFFGGFFQAKP